MDISKIKDSHRAFCKEYLVAWNGTKAYMKIYPDASEESARRLASQLLTNVDIKAYIEYIQEDLLKLCGVSVLGNVSILKEMLEKKEVRETDKLKALEIINKMLGLNAPDKVENKIEASVSNAPSQINFIKKT